MTNFKPLIEEDVYTFMLFHPIFDQFANGPPYHNNLSGQPRFALAQHSSDAQYHDSLRNHIQKSEAQS